MKDLTEMKSTITSLEIAELTGKRHDNVLADIGFMFQELKIDALKFQGIYKDSMNRPKPLFNLNKELSLILVSGYSVKMRAIIVKRWLELEKEHSAPKQEIAPSSQADSFIALDLMTKALNLPESGKIQAYAIGMQDYPRFVQALPVYAVDKPIIDNHVEITTEGSSGATHALTYHLKNHNVEKSTFTINKILLSKGIIEKKSRESTKGVIKKYNSITKKGLKYGKNITNPKSQRETQPHYYDSKILELLILVGA